MTDFKTRLIAERDELKVKLDKLATFLDGQLITPTLHPQEQFMLDDQWQIMQDYLNILNERIGYYERQL